MSMNVTSCTYPIYQQNLQQNPTVCIENHPAWKGIMSSSKAESMLKDRDFCTYILYKNESGEYTISYLDMEGIIGHKNYYQKTDGRWEYRSTTSTATCTTRGPDVNDLVAYLVECRPDMCKPLKE